MRPEPKAIVFDLYGTLVRIRKPSLHRGIPRLLRVDARAWMELVREHLLVRRFPDVNAFVRFICDALAPGHASRIEEECLALAEREVASVESFELVHPLLAFLKRRGYALGLLSNLSSVHKEPVSRLGLAKHFVAMYFSCDEGARKPSPSVYLELCDRLGVEPRSVLMVGNSVSSDVKAPRGLGMHALRVGSAAEGDAIATIGELGFRFLGGDGQFEPLVPETIRLGSSTVTLRGMSAIPESDQGRYNLVACPTIHSTDSTNARAKTATEVFCKRFLFPESAYVEELAHRLLVGLGMSRCDAIVTRGPEPCLVLSKAPGSKLAGPLDSELAFELGRHFGVAYILANADIRPRNAFVSYERGRPVVTMVDLEHCFLDRALDLTGLADPFRPQTLDRLSETELQARSLRRVLNERTIRRAVASFLDVENAEGDVLPAFIDGWVDAHDQVRTAGERFCGIIEERVYTEPFLIIGTQAYRRAMAAVDLRDMRERIQQRPEAMLLGATAQKQRA